MEKNYVSLIREDLIAHLQEMGGQISGGNVTKIICPSCGESEAWTKLDDPTTLHCNRKSKCGVSTHRKAFAPHLWGNWSQRFPPTEQDPNATARAYLSSRGLDPSKLDFEQSSWRENGNILTTVAFRVP